MRPFIYPNQAFGLSGGFLRLLLLLIAAWPANITQSTGQQLPASPPALNHRRQIADPQPIDTAQIFSLRDLAEIVFAHHPIVKQAALLSAGAQAKVLQARGGFDPMLDAGFNRKVFGGTDYYNKWANELRVPLWPGGIDLKAGYDRYVGTYVNPETQTPVAGLAGVGLAVPLGQGLLIDARRSTLRQARILVTAAEADRVKQINEVWLQAAKDYWNWYYAYQQATLIQEGVNLAETRFQAISRRVDLGDQAPIDSVEARIIAQDRLVQAEQLRVELQNARLILSNHLWNQNAQPVELPERAVPQPARLDNVSAQEFGRLTDQAATQHPTLLRLGAEIRQLGVEERYRRELLKPRINVSGTLLSRGDFYRTELPPTYDFGCGNYRLGVDFAFPLFLRQQRGQLQQARLQVQETVLEQQQSQRTILNQVTATYNALRAYERQLAVQSLTIANQRTLLQAELQKYDLGESTIFLINSRESKLIDLLIKQEGLRASYEKSLAELYYYAGTRSLTVD
ncbi:outer membrane efflux protein [Hymenobacter roseosalivarius DSM 11622]|uniref:Outer membrane efflux protein n=1 Tax=Hymenobacter roseosalivarius DSM 11622 TaxID=645990 RepID=A0A1W1VBP8_9BACT|nr:TolC family protein [Hymenobacter roseosalivarius]SMB90887.1 outer membrane efflux protein [Hymenobacter roseosalivarius DSM 11622]